MPFTGLSIIGGDEEGSLPVQGSRMFDIRFVLSAEPPSAWAQSFEKLWAEHGTCPVRLEGTRLVVRAMPEEMERQYHSSLEEAVRHTNASYEQSLEDRRQADAKRAEYIDENRHRIRGLGKRLGYKDEPAEP